MDDRAQLIGQLKNRALIYMELYDVLAEELGPERAEALMTRAIYRRGRSAGKAFSRYAPQDLAGLKSGFLAAVPGGDAIFQPEVLRDEPAALDIQLGGCPLKEAWREAGLPEEKRRHPLPHRRRSRQRPLRRRRLCLPEPNLDTRGSGLLLPEHQARPWHGLTPNQGRSTVFLDSGCAGLKWVTHEP